MKKLILSIFDTKAEVFHAPYTIPTVGVAYRDLADNHKRGGQDNALAAHPEDYELYQVGVWDDEFGRVDTDGYPVRLLNVGDLVLQG
ncbi:MAG: nonstructural protein [Microvirus sp.]|nr:MAG: nonstructural protein [Microvirus sp.]